MAFRADIAFEHQAAYQRWHNNEHIPERLSVPGFVRGRRYRSVVNDTRFLMYYDTQSLRVLTSGAYLAALNAPTVRTRAALRWFQNPTRTAYSMLDVCGAPELSAAPVVAVGGFALPTAERPFQREAMQRLAACSGILRVLAYRIDPAGSTVATDETSVHGAAPSPLNGLLVVHSADLDLLDRESAWRALNDATMQWAASNSIDGDLCMDVYSLEFALEASPTATLTPEGEI